MSGDLDEIRAAMRGPYTCDFEIWRIGGSQPCGQIAVALQQRSATRRNPYPVCAYHARGDMVPLEEIADALRRFGAGVSRA